ncbi:MAG: NADH-quinone oxidoreductase subunit G, partial [Rhodobacteraceae bacterium]|nr:NADH-quinone oxidoreductase subunit G [Paracoccaceae bacterium]
RSAMVAEVPHLERIDEVAENEWQAEKLKKPGKATFRNTGGDFYLSNPIARASEVMAELSANAKARDSAKMAAE